MQNQQTYSPSREIPYNKITGKKDEWRAVIDHQQDIGNALEQMKQRLQQEVAKEQIFALEQKRQQVEMVKQAEQNQILAERQWNQQILNQNKVQEVEEARDKLIIGRKLVNDYQQNITLKDLQKKELAKKDIKMDEDMINRAIKSLKDERVFKSRKKAKLISEIRKSNELQMAFKARNKNSRPAEIAQRQKDIKRFMSIDDRRMDAYNKRFDFITKQQRQRFIHQKNLLLPSYQRQRYQYEDFLQKVRQKEIEKMERIAKLKAFKRQQDNTNLLNIQKYQMEQREKKKEVEDIERQEWNKIMLQKEKSYYDDIKKEKQKKKEKQLLYFQQLEAQKKNQANKRQSSLNMPTRLKMLNQREMEAYKAQDHNAYALIPGINSSKYKMNRPLYDKYNPNQDLNFYYNPGVNRHKNKIESRLTGGSSRMRITDTWRSNVNIGESKKKVNLNNLGNSVVLTPRYLQKQQSQPQSTQIQRKVYNETPKLEDYKGNLAKNLLNADYSQAQTKLEKEIYDQMGISKQDRSDAEQGKVQKKYIDKHTQRVRNNSLYNNIFDPYKPYAKHSLLPKDYGKQGIPEKTTKHNPLSNPMSRWNQNPYIKNYLIQQVAKIDQRKQQELRQAAIKSSLQQMAQNNLIS